MQDIWEQCRVETDGDGDYPFRYGTAACWVHVDDQCEPTMVRVVAQAAYGIPSTAKVLREINEVNTRCRSAAVSLCGGTVLVTQAILAVAADHDTLEQACSSVGGVADDIGALMAAVYGGSTPYDADADAEPEAADGECAC